VDQTFLAIRVTSGGPGSSPDMSTVPMSPINESANKLFDRRLEHCKRRLEHCKREHAPEAHLEEESAAAAAPPTKEAGISPMPASPVAAAPLPRAPSDDDGLCVLQALTEHLMRASDPFGPALEQHTRHQPTAALSTSDRPSGERQAGGAILRFPGRIVPPGTQASSHHGLV